MEKVQRRPWRCHYPGGPSALIRDTKEARNRLIAQGADGAAGGGPPIWSDHSTSSQHRPPFAALQSLNAKMHPTIPYTYLYLQITTFRGYRQLKSRAIPAAKSGPSPRIRASSDSCPWVADTPSGAGPPGSLGPSRGVAHHPLTVFRQSDVLGTLRYPIVEQLL
jgi:hypothetical protein